MKKSQSALLELLRIRMSYVVAREICVILQSSAAALPYLRMYLPTIHFGQEVFSAKFLSMHTV